MNRLHCTLVALPLIWPTRPMPTPPFTLPAPTGAYSIGTTSWHVADPTRMESFVAAPTHREVRVLAWYPIVSPPANASANRAPYLREPLDAKTFGTAIRSPGAYDTLAEVVTHSIVDAAPLAGGSPLPVLIFSHGYTGLVSSYSALLEDLAWLGFQADAGITRQSERSALYEAALEGLALFVILQIALRLFGAHRRPGLISALFFAGYGTFRFICEFFREPDTQFIGPVSMGMALSIPVWLGAGVLFWIAYRKPQPA